MPAWASAQAVVGRAGEAIPYAVELTGAILILVLSVKPVWRVMRSRLHGPESTRESLGTDTTVVNAPQPWRGST